MRFGIFFLAEFIETIFLASVVTTVFLGGWQVPGLSPSGFPVVPQMPHIAVVLIQIVAWSAKVLLPVLVPAAHPLDPAAVPADQLMRLGWKQLCPCR